MFGVQKEYVPTFFPYSSYPWLSIINYIVILPSVKYRWHAVASWTWNAQDETCGICRMAFDGCCPDCKLPGDDCPLSESTCIVFISSNLFFYYQSLQLIVDSCCLRLYTHKHILRELEKPSNWYST